jgi:hypothetical protein
MKREAARASRHLGVHDGGRPANSIAAPGDLRLRPGWSRKLTMIGRLIGGYCRQCHCRCTSGPFGLFCHTGEYESDDAPTSFVSVALPAMRREDVVNPWSRIDVLGVARLAPWPMQVQRAGHAWCSRGHGQTSPGGQWAGVMRPSVRVSFPLFKHRTAHESLEPPSPGRRANVCEAARRGGFHLQPRLAGPSCCPHVLRGQWID